MFVINLTYVGLYQIEDTDPMIKASGIYLYMNERWWHNYACFILKGAHL